MALFDGSTTLNFSRLRATIALGQFNWEKNFVGVRITTRKPAGWEHLFDVPGQRWEDKTEELKAMHVTCPGKHVVVYAYKKASEFNVVTYLDHQYSDPSQDKTLWLGPMETMCIILECLKEVNGSTPPTSKPGT